MGDEKTHDEPKRVIMKRYFGKTLNISNPIIGKLIRQPVWINRKECILVSNSHKFPKGYAAFITKDIPTQQNNSPILFGLKEIEQLKDGGIISIEPDGKVNILYEINSPDNILMITGKCNYSCIMCPQPKVATEQDRTSINMKLISLMDKRTPSLGITGGEPTLIGDKLFDIISACKKKLPRTALTLLTNGRRFEDKEYARKLALINHPDLVIDIPLHADTDTEHDAIIKAKGFYRTVEGLYNLALLRQKIGIRIVIHKLTYKRLPQLAEFIYRNFPFVFHVAFMQMETIGLARNNIDSLWIDPYGYNNELERAVTCLAQRDINVSVYNAQLCVLPKNIWKYARKSISLWKNIYLSECNNCDYKEDCGGLFASSEDKHSIHIKALKK